MSCSSRLGTAFASCATARDGRATSPTTMHSIWNTPCTEWRNDHASKRGTRKIDFPFSCWCGMNMNSREAGNCLHLALHQCKMSQQLAAAAGKARHQNGRATFLHHPPPPTQPLKEATLYFRLTSGFVPHAHLTVPATGSQPF